MSTPTRTPITAIIDCPVCCATLHLDYWPPEPPYRFQGTPHPGDSADVDGDFCPCGDSSLVDHHAYHEAVLERCREATS